MATVEFTTAQLNVMAYNGGWGVFGDKNVNSPAQSCFQAVNNAQIVLFSGTIPAQPRLMTASNFSTALAFWRPNGPGGSEVTTFTPGATTTCTTTYKAAIATGTASWFAYVWYNATPPATGGSLQQRIIGTVGTIGSGEDLEMVTTSIVSGSQYRVYNLRITLPSTYTY